MIKITLQQLSLILLVGFIGLATTSWAEVPRIHSPAPDFTLPDISGKKVNLSNFKDKKNVILTFYRGWVGYWCSNCKRQLVQLMKDYDKLTKYDAELVLISPSDEKKTKEFLNILEKESSSKVSFPVLIDSGHKVVELYKVTGNKAIPSVFIIDKKGTLRFKYIGQDVSDRPTTEHLIEILGIVSTKKSNPPTSDVAVAPTKNKQELKNTIDKHMASLLIAKAEGLEPANFTLKKLNGKEVSLSDYRGKVVFLNFWATWCPPCRGEMPSMEKLYQKFKGKDFVMLAVSLREKEKTVEKFVQKNGLTFPVLLDPRGKAGGDYMVSSIPTTYLIDKQGKIIGRAIGGRDWANENSFNLFSALLEIE